MDEAFLDAGIERFGEAVRAVEAFRHEMWPRLMKAADVAAGEVPGFSRVGPAKVSGSKKDPYGPWLQANLPGRIGARDTSVEVCLWWAEKETVLYVDLGGFSADERRPLRAVPDDGIQVIDYWSVRRLACRRPARAPELTEAVIRLARALVIQLDLPTA